MTEEEKRMTDWLKSIAERKREMGYNGCHNCLHQIAPLRMCYWAEHGGDGIIHMICPKWDKKETKVDTKDNKE